MNEELNRRAPALSLTTAAPELDNLLDNPQPELDCNAACAMCGQLVEAAHGIGRAAQ